MRNKFDDVVYLLGILYRTLPSNEDTAASRSFNTFKGVPSWSKEPTYKIELREFHKKRMIRTVICITRDCMKNDLNRSWK